MEIEKEGIRQYMLSNISNNNKVIQNSTKKSFKFDTQITTHAIYLAKVDAIEFLSNAKLFLKTQRFVYSYYKLDKLCTVYDVYNIESIAIGQKMKYFVDDLPAVDGENPFIKEKKDLTKIKNINFNNSRCKFVLDLIDYYKKDIGSDYKARFCAPFSLAVNIRGFNNLINDIYSDRQFVKELFKVINYEVLAPWISIQRERLANSSSIASGADAWVTIPNVNLMIIEDVIIPSYLELKELVGNIYLSLMGGGARYLKNPKKFLDLQKILNPYLVKGFDPDVEALGPEMFRDYACQNNMDLLLGIEPRFILDFSIEEIVKRIKKYIDVGLSINKKFTLYFNDIPASISPNKLKKVFDGVRKVRESKRK